MGERKVKAKGEKIKNKLPKISWEGVKLIIVLLLFSGIQAVGLFSPKSEFEKAKEMVIRNPQDFEARLVLAEELLQNNRMEEAEQELIIASRLQQWDNETIEQWGNENQSVLGKQASKLKELVLQKQENDPQDLEILIQRWQEILEEKPNYRDSWLKLALYLIRVGKIPEAREAIQKAKDLDPNYEVTRELEKFLP